MKVLRGICWGLALGALFVLGVILCRGIAGPFIYSVF
jgi:hypothetical protein